MMLHPRSRSSGIQTSVCFSKATTASRTLRVVKNLDSVRKARRSNVPDVKRIVCFHSPCIEDHGGAVDFKLIFGVVKYLNTWFGCWEPYWVDKWPLWSKRPRGRLSMSSGIGSSRMYPGSYSASISSIKSIKLPCCQTSISFARKCPNGSSNYKKLIQYQIELSFGFLLQGYMLVANFISPTGPTDFYFALNPLPARPTGRGDFAAFANFG